MLQSQAVVPDTLARGWDFSSLAGIKRPKTAAYPGVDAFWGFSQMDGRGEVPLKPRCFPWGFLGFVFFSFPFYTLYLLPPTINLSLSCLFSCIVRQAVKSFRVCAVCNIDTSIILTIFLSIFPLNQEQAGLLSFSFSWHL